MSKNKQKNISQDDPLGLLDIIETIGNSAIPDQKKVQYLTMIEDGSFSYTTLEEFEKDLEMLAQEAKKKLEDQKNTIADLEKKKHQLDLQLDTLAVESCKEFQQAANTFIDKKAKDIENRQETKNKKVMSEIYKRLGH